jgi:hypothetical protein
LPFKPWTAARREEALELGMADTLISKLGGLQQLVIRPVSSIRKYAALDQDPLAAGREQRVDAVLEGSLQWNGGKCESRRVCCTSRMASCSGHIAAKRIARISSPCRMRFLNRWRARWPATDGVSNNDNWTRHYTDNLAAYQDYLLGRFHWNNRVSNEEQLRKAIAYFQQAIAKDPNYALAYAGVADCQLVPFFFGFGEPHKLAPARKLYAEKALALDETLAEARTTLAGLKAYYGMGLARRRA